MTEWMNNMFNRNQWLWFHIFAGGIAAKILSYLQIVNAIEIIAFIFVAAVTWEFIEFFTSPIVFIYGSYKRFVQDSLGDIIGAVFCAILVLI